MGFFYAIFILFGYKIDLPSTAHSPIGQTIWYIVPMSAPPPPCVGQKTSPIFAPTRSVGSFRRGNYENTRKSKSK